MNLKRLFGTCLAGLVFASSPGIAQTFHDGGAALDAVLDSITTAPNPGQTSVAVMSDFIPDENDGYWRLNAGGALLNLIALDAGVTFGIFDAADESNRIVIYNGHEDPAGYNVRSVQMLNDGSVILNFADTEKDFAGNRIGFFVNIGDQYWYSNSSLNSDLKDRMVAYQGTEVDKIQIGLSAAGTWLTNEYILGWEAGSNFDFADFVVIVESFTPADPPPLAALGNFVWEDDNADGVQDAGEAGVDGVTVNLFRNPDGNESCDSGDEFFVDSTTTSGGGFYGFDGLTPGDFCVQFVLPVGGYVFTSQDLGGDNAKDSDADPVTGLTANVNLDPGENDPTWDAGIFRPASLGDFVWEDINGDGIQDSGEPGMQGVLVELLDCNDNVLDFVYTDASGEYHFVDLRPGSYAVRFTAPDGMQFTDARQGDDDTVDSDAQQILTNGTTTGTTRCIDLVSGEDNPNIDAGLVDIPSSSLGDFVWIDADADGIQDTGELDNGVEDIRVQLLTCGAGDALTETGVFTFTDENGLYLFENLAAGRYAVQFYLDGYNVSPIDQGADDRLDSDADPANLYRTACVDLDGDDQDLSLDAGVYYPASLGDFVWLDANGNGVQDDGENGVAGTIVALFDCAGNMVVDINGNAVMPVTTGADGAYSFDNLVPGSYKVKFTAPDGYGFTTANANGSTEANDSDAEVIMSNMEVTMGTTACVTLQSGENNPDVDAGLALLAECDLSVTATCAIVPEIVNDFVCSDAKPINTLQMTWNGNAEVDVVAYYGKVGDDVLTSVSGVKKGDVVSISGFAGAGNDIEWDVLDAATGERLGISRFHLSCSDSGMNGPEDCGEPQGNSKDDSDAFLNDWLLEGLIGENGMALQCTPPEPGAGAESCTFTTPAGPHCEGKVLSMSLRYLGGECTISNTQEDKAKCLVDGIAGDPVRIRVTDGGSKVFLDTGEPNVEVGDVVQATATAAGENEFRSNTVLEIYSSTNNLVQSVELHTSCSKPLNLGDQFGAVEVVGLNTSEGGNASLGAEVFFQYTITNGSIDQQFVDDAADSFGPLGSLSIGANGTVVLDRTIYVLPDDSNLFTNKLNVSGYLVPSGQACSASDSVQVTREEPPAPQLACDEIKPITQLSMVWNGADGVDVLTEGGQFFGNVQNGNLITFDVTGLGNDVELTLSGAVTGMSAFHVSCSDDNMDGPEDCPIPQGNNKGDEAGLINDWGLEAMIGETGSFVCGQDTTGEVLPTEPEPGTGGGIVLLSSVVDGNRIKMEMENLSNGDLFIESVDFVWPAGYTLKKFKFNGDFAKDIEKTSFGTKGSIMVPEDKAFEDDPNKRKIKPGEKRKLEIEFDEDIEKAGLTLSNFGVVVTFSDGTIIQLN